jgi:DHA2 family multidrug resistance protein
MASLRNSVDHDLMSWDRGVSTFVSSMAITMLAQRAQFHQVRVTEHLVPSAVPYQEALRQTAARFAAKGASHADAQQQAIGWAGQLVQAQSSLLSYIDVFWAFAAVAASLVVVALLMVRSIELGAGQETH